MEEGALHYTYKTHLQDCLGALEEAWIVVGYELPRKTC